MSQRINERTDIFILSMSWCFVEEEKEKKPVVFEVGQLAELCHLK